MKSPTTPRKRSPRTKSSSSSKYLAVAKLTRGIAIYGDGTAESPLDVRLSGAYAQANALHAALRHLVRRCKGIGVPTDGADMVLEAVDLAEANPILASQVDGATWKAGGG